VQGKYRHLSPEQIAQLEQGVARQTAFISELAAKRAAAPA